MYFGNVPFSNKHKQSYFFPIIFRYSPLPKLFFSSLEPYPKLFITVQILFISPLLSFVLRSEAAAAFFILILIKLSAVDLLVEVFQI